MNERKAVSYRQKGAALLIVLAFVVLLTGVSVAYLSRTTSDRQVAQSSFRQANIDQLTQSAMDNIIGDIRQEIINGSTAVSQADGTTVYTPTAAANMVPQRSGNAPAAPNLIRRSVRSDAIPAPGLSSRASEVNSTTNASANGRSVTLARWNTHYLLPKANTLNDDSYPPSPLPAPFNPYTPDPNGFTPPDWTFVTSEYGADVLASPNTDANGRSVTVVGRYAYAVYTEGGLLDMNVAGYPTDAVTSTATVWPGRKGSLAYADLTALGTSDAFRLSNPDSSGVYQVDRLVGWRNYATTRPSNNFPNTGGQAFAKNFQTDTANTRPAALFLSYVLGNTNGFLSANPTIWSNRTNQMFVQRQQLIGFRRTVGSTSSFSTNALQYLSTFSAETNAPSFSPPFNAMDLGAPDNGPGNIYAYRANAASPSATPINPNFLFRRVTTSFTRFDGTTAVVGEPLVKTRFPLRRLAWITYKGPSASLATTDPAYLALYAALTNGGLDAATATATIQAGTAANINKCFGLTFPTGGTAGSPWTYTNHKTSTDTTPASTILRLDQVADNTIVTTPREPDFFELLQAGIINGSLGQNTALPPGTSGGGTTGGNVFPDVHMSNTTHHILSIGAAIIDQADPDSIPMRIQFSPSGTVWTAYGVENLPYITQMYPIAGTSPNSSGQWATYLTFQLWNPHQNASTLPNNVRLRVDGAIGIFKGGNGETWSGTPQLIANGNNAGQSVTLNSAFSFSAPAPLSNLNTIGAAAAPGPAAGGAFSLLVAPQVP